MRFICISDEWDRLAAKNTKQFTKTNRFGSKNELLLYYDVKHNYFW